MISFLQFLKESYFIDLNEALISLNESDVEKAVDKLIKNSNYRGATGTLNPSEPDEVQKKTIEDFMKRAEADKLAQAAAEAQKTTIQKIKEKAMILAYYVLKHISSDALAHGVSRVIIYILKAIFKSLTKGK